MKKSHGLLVILLIIASGFAFGQERGVFAPIDMGARPAALGGAFCGLADDVQAAYWNPAGLVQLARPQITTTRTEVFGLGVNSDYLAYGQKVGEWAFALSRQSLELSPGSESFTYREQTMTFSLARRLRKLALGVNLKAYRLDGGNDLLNDSESGTGLDLAFLMPVKEYLQLGVTLQDVVSKLTGELQVAGQTRASSTDLLMALNLGVAYFGNRSTWTFDLTELLTTPKYRFGVEYKVADNLMVRAGYNPGRFSVGFGIISGKLVLDYAYLTHELKDEQRLTVGLSF